MNQTRPIIEKLYPEIGAGGFSRIDGTVAFYSRVNALLESDMVVVDFGAGRGAGVLDDPIKYRRALRSLKGKVKKVIGLDVDPAIMTNPSLDEAFIIEPGSPLPIDDESIDLVLSDYTFEHIDSPEKVVQELLRILKPGGWICARTPNKWGYISIGARLIPNDFHGKALRKLQPERKDEDIFTPNYKMNSSRTIR